MPWYCLRRLHVFSIRITNLFAEVRRKFATAAWNLIHTLMPALWYVVFLHQFSFLSFVLLISYRCLRFDTRVFAKDESIFRSSVVSICAVGPCWSNYVQLWAIRCVQIILEQIQAITYLAFNWISYECAHGRFYQQAKIVHLYFWLCFVFAIQTVEVWVSE